MSGLCLCTSLLNLIITISGGINSVITMTI